MHIITGREYWLANNVEARKRKVIIETGFHKYSIREEPEVCFIAGFLSHKIASKPILRYAKYLGEVKIPRGIVSKKLYLVRLYLISGKV